MSEYSSIGQYASASLDYSSRYSPSSWSDAQALGASNTFSYGDIATAFATGYENGVPGYIIVGFSDPVQSTGVVVRETYGAGFVSQIDTLDTDGGYHTVWAGSDASVAGRIADAEFDWDETSYLTCGLKVYINTDAQPNEWEEIDSVYLLSNTPVAATSGYYVSDNSDGSFLTGDGGQSGQNTDTNYNESESGSDFEDNPSDYGSLDVTDWYDQGLDNIANGLSDVYEEDPGLSWQMYSVLSSIWFG
jgi:hypothetical protein